MSFYTEEVLLHREKVIVVVFRCNIWVTRIRKEAKVP